MRSYRLFKGLPTLLLLFSSTVAVAQAPVAPAPAPNIPSLFNPRLRPEPAPLRQAILRILTRDDAPPLNFAGPDGALAGFGIDLARAICLDLKTVCTIQARRADLLVEALAQNAGDAIIPAPETLGDAPVALTSPFLPRPGRFALRQDAPPLANARADTLAGRTVGVIAGSAHATYLARFFPRATSQQFPSRGALLDAFGRGETELVFADSLDLAFWLNGVTAGGCCAFVPGAFLDSALFGQGVSLAVRESDDELRRALNGALARLDARGTIGELYLRYFPIPPL